MEAILYAEIYLICLLIASILLYWTIRNGMSSSAEMWLSGTLACFVVNFIANFLFTVFNRIVITDQQMVLSYLFKSLYHISLIIGVFAWCAFADVNRSHGWLSRGRVMIRYLILPAIPPVLVVLTNSLSHKLFYITENGQYVRGILFQAEMAYLLFFSMIYALRLLGSARHEPDPVKRSHLYIASTFPLCVFASWLLSFVGEAFPVICVAITIELLFLFLGTTIRQISMDRLTQINNRQNLMGFLNYKLNNHTSDVYLMMMDIDDFKLINDRFGHLEGDSALTRVSTGLKQACGPYLPRPYIARYGGDEFIVVMETGDEATVESVRREIRDKILEQNKDGKYELNISIGTAKLKEGQTPKELIHEADQQLYEIKKQRKSMKKGI